MDSTKINSEQKSILENHMSGKLSLFAMVNATQIHSFLDLFH